MQVISEKKKKKHQQTEQKQLGPLTIGARALIITISASLLQFSVSHDPTEIIIIG